MGWNLRGSLLPEPGLLEAVREITADGPGVVLIFDEVKGTGLTIRSRRGETETSVGP